MSLDLCLSKWPAADRVMWEMLLRQAGPLDDRGVLSQLRMTSLQTLEYRYGRWLGWLAQFDPQALGEPPTDRTTILRLTTWLQSLNHMAPMSRLMFISGVLRVLSAAAPEGNWQIHRRLEATLKRAAGRGDPERKRGRILSSAVLLDAGMDLARTEADADRPALATAKRRRDGTLIAVLALMPMRRRAFVNLQMGESVHVSENQILISLPEDLTKNGVPWEAPVPSQIVPLLRGYLDDVRPWLMARGNQKHSFLWVGDYGRPYQPDYFGHRVREITMEALGVRVTPHLFRDAAATTLARISPEAARLIRPILAHSSFGTAERHYIQAGSIEAGRDYADVVAGLKKAR